SLRRPGAILCARRRVMKRRCWTRCARPANARADASNKVGQLLALRYDCKARRKTRRLMTSIARAEPIVQAMKRRTNALTIVSAGKLTTTRRGTKKVKNKPNGLAHGPS